MIPISDINPAKNSPIISRVFLISVVLTYVLIQPKTNIELINFFYKYAAIPCELVTGYPISIEQYYQNDCNLINSNEIFPFKNVYLGLIYSNFFHANFLHILGNLWSFWIFGNNVEDKLGKINFLLFLLFVGVISISFHVLLNQNSLITVVGASGIVSGLMGAYVYLFPNARLLVLVPFGILFPTTIKAKYFMLFWFISQIFIAFGTNNISWEAHVGGFIIGYCILKVSKYNRFYF
jgi:membrane associated rhomboid family serine protease